MRTTQPAVVETGCRSIARKKHTEWKNERAAQARAGGCRRDVLGERQVPTALTLAESESFVVANSRGTLGTG